MMRLSERTVSLLPTAVEVAQYDRSVPGIVHLGIGAFHRAHMAVMTDAAMAVDGPGWSIIGASLRSPDTRDALGPQDGLYTVAALAPEGEHLRLVRSISQILLAPEDPELLIGVMADPGTRIVSLTVTEKGYCHDPATGTLTEAHPDIIHDLADLARPRTVPGFLLAALQRRRVAGIPPFTVLCCDNLPSNGKTVHRVISRMADLIGPELGEHVRNEVACPGTMVDRIVPATTDADRGRVSARLGLIDAWPVVAEPFSQWVIEDNFPMGRPRWEIAGAQFVREVEPFELMKLRLLNGAHSSLAYLGLLAGHETVAEASADPKLARFLEGYWAEVRPAVPPPEGTDLAVYCGRLLERFRNPAIRHRLVQIATDGSQKLPQRLLGTVRDNLAGGRSISHAAKAIAAFAVHVAGDSARDPLAAEMSAALNGLRLDPDLALRRFIGLPAIFGSDLPRNTRFTDAMVEAMRAVLSSNPLDSLGWIDRG